jgi:ComF family protein
MLNAFLNLIFPPKCEICRGDGEAALCPSCFNKIKFMKPQMGIHNITVYEGVVREAIHRLKFNGRKKLAEPLGILAVRYLSQASSFKATEIDAIVPVPLHKKRYRQRGFNQSELVAKVLGKYLDLPVAQPLERVIDTQAQFSLKREERFTNIAGAFKVVSSEAVYNRRLLLIDDIYTTGATIAECARTLKIAGAGRIEILALSRAVMVE